MKRNEPDMVHWARQTSAGFIQRGEHSVPSGKPVLHFLHGNGYCGRTYWPMLRPLAAHFDLVLSDAQGHGDSDHGGRFHGWNRSAEVALESIHALAPKFGAVPWMAVGHSFGGVLTALMLAQAPERFRRAVLLDPVLFPPLLIGVMMLSDAVGLSARNSLAKKARKRRQVWADRAEARAYLHERGMFKGWSDASLDAYVTHALKDSDAGVELKCRPSREAEIFASYPRRLWYSLARIQTPMKIEYGDQTYPFVAKSVRRWQALGQNGQRVAERVPGGHCFMQSDPANAARRVREFLLGA